MLYFVVSLREGTMPTKQCFCLAVSSSLRSFTRFWLDYKNSLNHITCLSSKILQLEKATQNRTFLKHHPETHSENYRKKAVTYTWKS